MWWIIILIPICIWVSVSILSKLNFITLGIIGITVILFLWFEIRQISKDKTKSKNPLWVIGLIVLSVLLGAILSLLK